MTPEAIAFFGSLTIDDLVFADGSTRWAVPGGNAAYSARWELLSGHRASKLSRRLDPITLGKSFTEKLNWRAAVVKSAL
jgi:hypothetical protein